MRNQRLGSTLALMPVNRGVLVRTKHGLSALFCKCVYTPFLNQVITPASSRYNSIFEEVVVGVSPNKVTVDLLPHTKDNILIVNYM